MCIRDRFFFFKQKTAYEIGVRLVGSEMCIRDSPNVMQKGQYGNFLLRRQASHLKLENHYRPGQPLMFCRIAANPIAQPNTWLTLALYNLTIIHAQVLYIRTFLLISCRPDTPIQAQKATDCK
eukprot:TRINITY_DN11810_c0_g1_i3.p2 TRINITY_DN11810_c0_g1~~TRINITY_DN11810_c0_g1_i3.p2  ORF type:complete len:123 (+),score=13.73 TRINITY_DN11810_c0_g1_i3:2-370(+)